MISEDAELGEPQRVRRVEGDAEAETGAGTGTAADRAPLTRYAGGALVIFAAAGLCIGLATNITLGFLIEQFVEPGTAPTNHTLVGIMLVHGIVTPFILGPVVAVGTGVVVGRVLPGRNFAATAVGGVTATVGFYVMVALALGLTVLTLQIYGPGGGGGGSSPISPDALGAVVLKGGLPAAIAGAVGGAVGSRLH